MSSSSASSHCSPYCQRAGSWTNSKLISNEVTHIWTIDDFDFREAGGGVLDSSTFSAAENDEVYWFMRFYPNGEKINIPNDPDLEENASDTNDFTSLYVCLSERSKRKQVFAKFEVDILDEKGIKKVSKNGSAICLFNLEEPKKQSNWGWNRFNEKTHFFRTTLLSNNKLILRCKIHFSRVHDVEITTHHHCTASLSQLNASKCNPSGKFSTFLANQQFADVVVSAEGKQFPAHKVILAAHSPVFAAMFQHHTKENQLNCVEIEDINVEIVDEMLRFIYTGECENLDKLAEGVLVAADKYDLEKLKTVCAGVLIKTVSVENAAKILLLSDRHSVSTMKNETIKFIITKLTEVQNTAEWKQVLSNPQLMDDICEALHRRIV